MDEQNKLGIGATLAQARQAAGLPFSEIVTALKIREVHLQALEDEDFDILPGDTYVIGFISTYADYLSLDAAALVAQYKTATNHSAKREEVTPMPTPKGEGLNPIVLGAGVVLAMLLLGGLIWLVVSHNNARMQEGESTAPVSSIAPVVAAVAQVAKPAAKKAVASELPKNIPTPELPKNIEVRAIERTWMRIESDDGRVLFSSIVNTGDSFSLLTDRTYIMATHDAGALAFFNEDTQLSAVGQKGQLLTGYSISPVAIARGKYKIR